MDEGTQFGPYEVIKRIGVGGMAEIFLARTKGIGGFEKFLALKFIHSKFAEDEDFIELLIDEAKIAVQLTHPNVGQIFDLGCIDGHYYIAMEFIDGKDLYQIQLKCAESETHLPFDIAAYVGMHVAAGLHYAHGRADNYGRPLNIIHRDVSPQNILLSYDGQVKLVDFGIAKANERKRQTESGVIKGKFFWMSPEQAWGEVLDSRSDIFSVGICLFEMVCGELLYNEERALVLLDKVRRAVIPNLRDKRPDIPSDLEKIILKALAREPDDRYQTAGELQGALTGFLYSLNPNFNASTLGDFVGNVLGENRFVLPIPESELAKQSKPEGTMDLHDYDNTRSHSVLFDVAAHDAKQNHAPEDEEEDRTIASFMSVTPERIPYLDDDIGPEKEARFEYDGDQTALLDTSFISDSEKGGADIPDVEVNEPTNISVPPPLEMETGSSSTVVSTRQPLPEMEKPNKPAHVRRVTLPPAPKTFGIDEETLPLSEAEAHSLSRGSRPPPAMAPPNNKSTPNQGLPPQNTHTQPSVQNLRASASAERRLIPNTGQDSTGPKNVKKNPKSQMRPDPTLAKETTKPNKKVDRKTVPQKASPQKVKRGVESAARQPAMKDRFEAFKTWSLTPPGITALVLLLLFLYLVAAGLPFLMRGAGQTELSIKLLSLPSGAKVFIDGRDTEKKTDTLFENLRPNTPYEFRLEAEGFDPLVKTFLFDENKITPDGSPLIRQLILSKAKGTIRVGSKPEGCEVYANGRYVGQTPLEATGLSRERDDLVLLLRKAGYVDHREVLRWESKVQLKMDAVLKEEKGKSKSRRKRR